MHYLFAGASALGGLAAIAGGGFSIMAACVPSFGRTPAPGEGERLLIAGGVLGLVGASLFVLAGKLLP